MKDKVGTKRGRKPNSFREFKRKLEAEQIADADYAFALHAEVMRDENESRTLRLACANWITNRVLGKPKEKKEESGEMIIRVEYVKRKINQTDGTASRSGENL